MNRATTPGMPKNKYYRPSIVTAYVRTVIGRHSRDARIHIHDETAQTAAVLVRAIEWFNARGITVEHVLSGDVGAYRSGLWP